MGSICFRAQEEPGRGPPDEPSAQAAEVLSTALTPALNTLNSISLPNGESMLGLDSAGGMLGNGVPRSANGSGPVRGLSDAHLKEAAQLQKTWALETAMSMSPAELTADVQLLGSIGSGSSAVVYRGIYQGGEAALKIIVTDGRNEKPGIREALLSPHLRHPHVVSTYAVRGCQLTAEFIEEMATDVHATPPHVRTMLPALPSQPSEDGLGNPRIIRHERQGWREVLTRVGAIPNKHMLMLVQELCDAGSLGGAIRQGIFRPKPGVRTEALARRVLLRTATELCRGMVHIHTANVLHGDLKPANVLLARSRKDRRGYTVKVADFGLSKLLHADGSRVDSSAGGTLAYMSPEAFNGFFSRASDVYAFGMLLYEMVTGERPYEHMIPAQVMMGVSFGGLRPDWPVADWPELSALGARCLAQNPGDRPTFRELAEELVGLEEGLRAANKRLSADQVVALPELSAQASSGRAAYAASGASSGKALRGTSSLTPQTPVGVNSAPGLPSSGGPSEMLGGSSVPSAAANATACALSSIGVLAAIPEPLESATFSTAAAMIAAAQGLPAGTAADALAAGTAATAGTAGPGAADAVEAKSAHATCVQIAGSVIGLQAMAALDTAQEATNQLSTDSGRHDQLAQLHQEGQHVREAAGRGPYVQQGEIQAADMADVSPWTAATAVGAEDVELQGLAGPHTPPGW